MAAIPVAAPRRFQQNVNVDAPLKRALAAKNVTIRLSLADPGASSGNRLSSGGRGTRPYVKMLLHQALVADARRLA